MSDLAAERRRIEQIPLPPSIDALFAEACGRYGGETLWTFIETGASITYAGAANEVALMAGALRSLGVRRGTNVAIMLPNDHWFPITWLALARLGAVMVAVNTRYTATELDYVLADSGASYLVTNPAGAGIHESTPGTLARERVLVLDGEAKGSVALDAVRGAAEAIFEPPDPVGLEDLVALVYTSGTTGFPKGCMLTNRYYLILGVLAVELWPERPRRILSDTPFFYLDPQYELLMALFTGAHQVVAPRPSLTRFMGWVRDYEIDCANFWELLVEQPPTPEDRQHALRFTRTFGLHADKHAELEERFGLKAREVFGMTEVGLVLYVPWEAEEMVGSGSCGIPAPLCEARVIDPGTLADVPDGTVGELCVRGPGVSLGYHDKPEANAASFLEGGWFRTGDLFRRDERGYHYIVGRLKEMIRRSDENIAAREVEAVLQKLPEVTEAAVIGVPDPRRGEEVKAYLILDTGLDPGDGILARIFDHCGQHLASFKVPRYVEFRKELPRTASDKVAKGALATEKPDLRLDSFDRVDGVWRREEA